MQYIALIAARSYIAIDIGIVALCNSIDCSGRQVVQ